MADKNSNSKKQSAPGLVKMDSLKFTSIDRDYASSLDRVMQPSVLQTVFEPSKPSLLQKAMEDAMRPAKSLQSALELSKAIQFQKELLQAITLQKSKNDLAGSLPEMAAFRMGSATQYNKMPKAHDGAAIVMRDVSDIGTAIRKARKTMGLTQQNFADIAGVGRRFLSELESGKQTLEIGKVLKVAAAAGFKMTLAQVG